MFANAALRQIGEYMRARLEAKFPGGNASIDDVNSEVEAICVEHGMPGCVSLKRDANGSGSFVISDQLSGIMLASKISAETKRR